MQDYREACYMWDLVGRKVMKIRILGNQLS